MKRFLFLFLSIVTTPLMAQTLSCDTSACGSRVNDFEEQQCRATKVLVCKGYNISSIPTIELQIQPTSHVVYLSVGDLPRVSLQPRQTGKTLNISHMFANGLENLRIQAFAGKEAQYNIGFVIRYNGQQLYSVSCDVNSCPQGKVSQPDLEGGPFFDWTFPIQVNSPVQHQQYSLSFSGLANGQKSAVYINDQYTGLSVQQAGNLRLPPSEYRIGVGVSGEQEVQHGLFQWAPRYLVQYTGNYYEQRVQGANDLQNFANLQPLPHQNVVRIGVVPIQTMSDGQQTYTLTQSDINRLSAQINKTVTSYVQPLSYGLQTWDVTFEPMYTSLVTGSLYTQIENGSQGEVKAENFVRDHLPDLINKYDVVIAYYGNANHGGAAAGNGFIHLPSGSVRHNPSVTNDQGSLLEELPLEIFYHEVSHVLEQYEGGMLRQWQAFAGADSGDMLGYHNEQDRPNAARLWAKPKFMDFYRDYTRGHVVVLNTMSHGAHYPAPATAGSAPYRYVGLFGTMRNGMKNVHDEPQVAIPAGDIYRIYNPRFGKYLSANASVGVTAAPWNLQSYDNEYVRLQNGANPYEFLHIDEAATEFVRSTNISEGAWSSRWVPVEIQGRPLLKNRWNGHYLAMTNENTLIAVTNEERRTLPLENLVWEFIPHTILDSLSSGHSLIKSAWPDAAGRRIHLQGTAPTAGNETGGDGWLSSHWSFKVIDGKYVKITNRSKPTKSLHVEFNGLGLQASEAEDGWHSAQWELKPVDGLANTYRLKNRHRPNEYLNIEGMELKSSEVPAHYWSSYWTFPKVQ